MNLFTEPESNVPIIDEVNKLKTYYKLFYTTLITKVFEEKEHPLFTPKLPMEDVIQNASKALNIKHGTESDASEFEIDDKNRQIILNGLVYSHFKKETDGTITFLERDQIQDVELAMKMDTNREIEVEDWNNHLNWIPLSTYIDKLMTKYKSFDNKLIMAKQSELKVHYANVKRFVSDLDNVFTVKEYYNV